MITFTGLCKKSLFISVLLFAFSSSFATACCNTAWYNVADWTHHDDTSANCLVKDCLVSDCHDVCGHVQCKYYNKCK